MFTARRRFRFIAAATLGSALVMFAACDWPQARYGPEQTGFNPFETSLSATNVSGLKLRWSAPVGSEAPPTIAGGVLFVSSNKLYAFDAATGTARWSSAIVGYARSSPAVANGVVYVGAGNSGAASLYALEARSGTTRWSQPIGRADDSPTFANGVVYVTGDKLYAFDATTGAQLWSAAPGNGADFLYSPAVANGVVYVNASDKLAVFDATTGAQLASITSTSGYFYGSPVVANGVVYVSGGDKVIAINAMTRSQLWSAPVTSGHVFRSPAVANGVVYVGDGERVTAISTATGAQLWSTAVPAAYGSPIVANGVVYGGANFLFALNAATGARLWTSSTAGAAAVIANGVVYGADGTIVSAHSLPIATPRLSISPAFPDAYVFGDPTATARTFTITNVGSMPTSVITNSLSGTDAAHFRLTSDGCAGRRLAARASCAITVSFTPTQWGPRTAWLTSKASAGGTAEAMLTGTARRLTVTPRTRDFGDIFEGSTSPSAVFDVTNLTGAPLGSITNVISPGTGFAIADDACAGRAIANATSCSVAVRFAPGFAGRVAATLTTQAAGFSVNSSLTGRGLSRLAIAPSGKDFGSVQAGTTASTSFTITNVSPDPTGPITAVVEGAPVNWFSITSDGCAGRTLASNSSCVIVVAFAPTGSGLAWGALRITPPFIASGVTLIGTGS